MVSALSCLGGSNRGNKPTNCHGAPGLSFDFSGISCRHQQGDNGLGNQLTLHQVYDDL